MRSSRWPSGLTLVVIVILGLLLARPLTCRNHACNVATAIATYESSQGALRVGASNCCWHTWLAAAHPYLEQQALSDLSVWDTKDDQPDASHRYVGSRNRLVIANCIAAPTFAQALAAVRMRGGF